MRAERAPLDQVDTKKAPDHSGAFSGNGGAVDGARTRDPRRDRPVL